MQYEVVECLPLLPSWHLQGFRAKCPSSAECQGQPSHASGHRCKSTLGPSAVYNTHQARGNEAKTKVRLVAGCDDLVSIDAWWNSFSDFFAPRSPPCHPRPGRSFRATGPSAQNCRPSVQFGSHVLLTIEDVVKSVVSHSTVCSSIPSRSAKQITNRESRTKMCQYVPCYTVPALGTQGQRPTRNLLTCIVDTPAQAAEGWPGDITPLLQCCAAWSSRPQQEVRTIRRRGSVALEP